MHAQNENLSYHREPDLTAAEFIDVLRRSTLAERRPVDEPDTIRAMLENADLILDGTAAGKTGRRVACRHGLRLLYLSR